MSCAGYGTNGVDYHHLFALPFRIDGVGIVAHGVVDAPFVIATDLSFRTAAGPTFSKGDVSTCVVVQPGIYRAEQKR